MLKITPDSTHDHGPCPCCDAMSRIVAGLITRDGNACAAYRVHWTLGQIARHEPTFTLFLGKWGEDATARDRVAIILRYRPGSGFMVVDAGPEACGDPPLAGRGLPRDEVVGTPLAKEAFELVDVIWLQDGRIGEIVMPAS